MLKKRWPTFLAILIITVIGFSYSNGYINRMLALAFVLPTFLLCQGMTCYLMYKDQEDWHRLAIMSVTFSMIMAVLLFL